ncbi:MAG: ATP-binding protein, partial [Candidatus Omnitrophota bacterium]|nr:ATP-binding protein [Candidatus Omnitrophota bacterium]
MDVKKLILKNLAKKGELKVSDIVAETGFSRAYVNRFFKELGDNGKIVLVGKSNQARYFLAHRAKFLAAKKRILSAHRIFKNKNLSEDAVLDEIKRTGGIFYRIPKDIVDILNYAFTEMLNNAIEHSQSKFIEIFIKRERAAVRFDVIDKGIGIFSNIMKKKKLKNELEAIQDLIKGKQTTAPKQHSGEGIFFTSKVADILTFQSSAKKLIFH